MDKLTQVVTPNCVIPTIKKWNPLVQAEFLLLKTERVLTIINIIMIQKALSLRCQVNITKETTFIDRSGLVLFNYQLSIDI